MGAVLFLLLLGLPIVEIVVFVQAGATIGWLNVILATLFTALAGTAIIRWQGFTALQNLREAMGSGKPPVEPVVDGVFLLVTAPLMMTPGFVTDAIGFLLLVPPVRHSIARMALGRLKRAMDKGQVTIIRP